MIHPTHGQLRERQTQVKERENRSGVLKSLMRAAKGSARRSVWRGIDGELSQVGIYGRLGDLGEIDGFYDIAVSTASGALDYIVVDSAEGAQRCVEYLKWG